MEPTIATRIIEVVDALGGNKSEFARRIDVTPAYISKLGKQPDECRPSNLVISSICKEFGVSEDWLRTGQGDMFVPLSRSQEIAEFIGKIMVGEEDNFKRRFIAMLARLDESEWEFIERKALELFEETKKD